MRPRIRLPFATAEAHVVNRRGSVQGINSLLLVAFAAIILYLIARTRVDEPVTWIIDRIQAALR